MKFCFYYCPSTNEKSDFETLVPIIASSKLVPNAKIDAILKCVTVEQTAPFIGFTLHFPIQNKEIDDTQSCDVVRFELRKCALGQS